MRAVEFEGKIIAVERKDEWLPVNDSYTVHDVENALANGEIFDLDDDQEKNLMRFLLTSLFIWSLLGILAYFF